MSLFVASRPECVLPQLEVGFISGFPAAVFMTRTCASIQHEHLGALWLAKYAEHAECQNMLLDPRTQSDRSTRRPC